MQIFKIVLLFPKLVLEIFQQSRFRGPLRVTKGFTGEMGKYSLSHFLTFLYFECAKAEKTFVSSLEERQRLLQNIPQEKHLRYDVNFSYVPFFSVTSKIMAIKWCKNKDDFHP